MNYEVLHAMSRDDLVDYCHILNDNEHALADICTAQSNLIKDLTNAVKDMSKLLKMNQEFELQARSSIRFEEQMFNQHYENKSPVEKTGRVVDDVSTDSDLLMDVAKATKDAITKAAEGCFG